MQGRFITFDGIDGCGKSVQAQRLCERLMFDGFHVILTREPGGTIFGSRVRNILLETGGVIDPQAEAILFFADRAQHVAKLIRPALENGTVVLSDRHCYSTYAIQGHARGMDIDELVALNRFATGGLDPDLGLIFDLSVDIARERLNARATDTSQRRFDDEKREFHHRVREGFISVAQERFERVFVFDADRTIEAIHEEVYRLVADYLTREGVLISVSKTRCCTCGGESRPLRRDNRNQVVCNSCFERWHFFDPSERERWKIITG